MKKLILLLALVFAACSSAPKPYTEIRLSKNPEFTYQGQEEAFSGANLLVKQGKELPTNQLMPVSELSDPNIRFCHRYVPLCTMKYATACGQCSFFSSADHSFVAVNTGYDAPILTWKSYEWSFFVDGKKLFSVPMEYGSDGPIQRVDLAEGKPAVSFRRALELPASDKELPKTASDVFYNGTFFNERFGVDGSHAVFTYGKKIGFIGRKGGKEYVYFDGSPVSRAFDAIQTSACCAAPMTELRVFDNGALVFVGERDGYGVLTEIDLTQAPIHRGEVNTAEFPTKKKVLEDAATLGNRLLAQYRDREKCSDILAALGRKPAPLTFVECHPNQGSQRLFEASYTVPGSDAASVEQYLIDTFGMAPLHTLCCGWEPKDGKTGQVYLGDYRTLEIRMNSDETLINDRTKWNEIPQFHVTVSFIET
ncbi:MAG: DUF4952 domain-containing protein [Candidatus Peregrinibacteria bacterium]